jgi:hypothetical protein
VLFRRLDDLVHGYSPSCGSKLCFVVVRVRAHPFDQDDTALVISLVFGIELF